MLSGSAVGDFGERDAEFFQELQAGLGVTEAGFGVVMLLVLDRVGGGGQSAPASGGWQGERVDQGLGRAADLRQSHLAIFPPAVAPSGGRGTSGWLA